MKLTTGILAVVMMAGAVWAQTPAIINNGQSTTKAPTQATKPGASAPARAVAGPIHPAPITMAARPHGRLAPHKQVVLHPTIAAHETAPKGEVLTAKAGADAGTASARVTRHQGTQAGRQEVGDDWEARSVLQSGSAGALRFGVLDGEKVSGNRAD